MTEGSFSAKKKERVAMKRRYQIHQQRAVQQFRQLAREENPSIQMIFPMAEVVGLLQEGVGHLLREAGLALMNLVMEEEVRHLAGERHQQHPERRAHRWGKENGYCVVDGQKVPIRRTRLRTPEKREQRLQKRNVVDHLPEEYKADVKKKLQNAYAMTDYTEAKRALERLHRELMDVNPSAARSLEEGMEETLTVHQLRVPDQLRRSPCCTNVIESAFSIVETVCRNVKRWRPGDQIERWVGSGLLVAEQQFRKVIGHRQIPLLLSSMANAVSKKPIAKGAAVA